MDDNPYEPPKTESRASPERSTAALVILGALWIPASYVCGVITCCAVGASGQAAARATGGNSPWSFAGVYLGIPIGLLVWIAMRRAANRLLARKSRPK